MMSPHDEGDLKPHRRIVMLAAILLIVPLAGCTSNASLAPTASPTQPDMHPRSAISEGDLEVNEARSAACVPPISTCGFATDAPAKLALPEGAWVSAVVTAFWNATGPAGSELELLVYDGPDGGVIGGANGTAPLLIMIEAGTVPSLGGNDLYVHGAPAAPGAAFKLNVHLVLVVSENIGPT